MDRRPDVWLITGIPGAGKTTVARLLAVRLGRGVHIEGDLLQEWIRSGAVWPGEEPEEEAERQIKLNVRNQCLLARSYHASGFTPVLDYVACTRSRLAEYQTQLAPLDLGIVVLAPGGDVALERDRSRQTKAVAEGWLWLQPIFERELRDIGHWIDTTTLTAEETVDRILDNA